ncbi:MAG TPA: thioredoxin-disulfide reductase, partial [Proteobacteria bacterium]|nr:thioredoxin-disulfide reductase [Pseudomonadota bacterium]
SVEHATVEKVESDGDLKSVHTDKGSYRAKTVVIASGTQPRRLNVPGESKLFGRGVSTCATCDGPFFRNRVVGVVGGGDSAVQESIYLSRFAKEVHIIHRRDQLRAVKDLQEKAFSIESIKFHWNRVPIAIEGENKVEAVILKDTKTGDTERLPLDGLFIFIGLLPNTSFLVDLPLTTDEHGFIVTNENMETSVPGIYAVGDVRSKSLRQIATAVADGAIAAFDLEKYLG